MPQRKLLIVSGETSGELYGALLASHLKKNFQLLGIGGKHMKEAGVDLIAHITNAFGLFEIFGQIRKLKENFKKAEETLKEIDGLILIDFPDFNLKLAKKAKALGKKVLYYVSPQIWAWRRSRIKLLKKYVDYMAVILPFEEHFYREAKIPVKYVGHPMYEIMKKELGDTSLTEDIKERLREKFKISKGKVITLMPGSRPSEIIRKMPLMVNIIELFDKNKFHFIIPKAPNIEFPYKFMNKIRQKSNVTVIKEQAFTSLAMSDLAVITSGTATLQATLLNIPMIVVYKVNPLSYLVGKILIRGVKHISLPNVIADFLKINSVRVPEFIQDLKVERISEEMYKLIEDFQYRNQIINFLKSISTHFQKKEASKEVSRLCLDLFC